MIPRGFLIKRNISVKQSVSVCRALWQVKREVAGPPSNRPRLASAWERPVGACTGDAPRRLCLNLDPASLRRSAGFREEEHGAILTALEHACTLIASHVERVGDMSAFATDPELLGAVLEAKRILDGIQDHLS